MIKTIYDKLDDRLDLVIEWADTVGFTHEDKHDLVIIIRSAKKGVFRMRLRAKMEVED